MVGTVLHSSECRSELSLRKNMLCVTLLRGLRRWYCWSSDVGDRVMLFSSSKWVVWFYMKWNVSLIWRMNSPHRWFLHVRSIGVSDTVRCPWLDKGVLDCFKEGIGNECCILVVCLLAHYMEDWFLVQWHQIGWNSLVKGDFFRVRNLTRLWFAGEVLTCVACALHLMQYIVSLGICLPRVCYFQKVEKVWRVRMENE